jgi:hypothetical protein
MLIIIPTDIDVSMTGKGISFYAMAGELSHVPKSDKRFIAE